MSDERLELVTDFATLKAGMLVVVKPCPMCGRAPRSMLSEFVSADALDRSRRARATSDSWLSLPGHVCSGNRLPYALDARAVRGGIVYRVVDGLDPAADEGAAVADEMCARVRANRVWAR